MGTTSGDLFLAFDPSRRRALRVQVEDGLRAAIRAGRLAPGATVPSSRALAGDLGITRKVVVEAYDQLVAEGYLIARRGSGTTVNAVPAERARPTAPGPAAPVEVDFRPGRPDLGLFPRLAWARATRSALRGMGDGELTDEDRRGLPRLREQLVEHLARTRGVAADPGQVVVCAGFGHGFALVLAALLRAGHRRVAVEDPGYPAVRAHLAALGVPFDPIPVDDDGLVVDALDASPARIAVVTPAHQSPTGVVLSPRRRHRIVEWARRVDGIVVEDDYDAEYRYDRRPVGALQGLAPDRVVHCGSTSKTLASGLRVGWLVLPHHLVEPVVAQRAVTDGTTSTVLQATFAAFLADGDLARHLRRTRRTYRGRRDAILAELARLRPDLVPTGIAAGLNVLVTLPVGTDEAAVVARAAAAGVRVRPLGEFRVAPGDTPGLVLGYGTTRRADAVRGVRALATALVSAETVPPGRDRPGGSGRGPRPRTR